MKKHISFLIYLLVLATISSCKKEKAPTPTSLELNIVDELGNPVSGASAKIYASQTDWSNDKNQVGETQFSDASGKVSFTGLSNIEYYWLIEKDCKNNVNGTVTTISSLTSNTANKVNVVLSSTGTLKLVNTSGNPYRIFINGKEVMDMNGNTSEYGYYLPTGSYTVRVLQLSGYVLTPTDLTYSGTMQCGQMLNVTFPN